MVARYANREHADAQQDVSSQLVGCDSANAVVCNCKDDIHEEQTAKEPKWAPNVVDVDTRRGKICVVANEPASSPQHEDEEDIGNENLVDFAQQELLDAPCVILEEQTGKDEIERHTHLLEDLVQGIVSGRKVSLVRDMVNDNKQDADAFGQINVLDALFHRKGLFFNKDCCVS